MTESVSTRVVRAVAEEKGVDPIALPPLHDAIDPTALDALFEPTRDGDRQTRRDCAVRFSYAGRDVRVRDGEITVGRTSQP